MSSPRDNDKRGVQGDDIVSKLGSMSDADLDAFLAGSVAARSTNKDAADPFAEIAEKMTAANPAPEPEQPPTVSAVGTPLGALTEDGSLNIEFSEYTPPEAESDAGVFGKDEPEPEKIDPTTVPDQGVQSSVRDRESTFDPSALNPDSDDFYDPSPEDYADLDTSESDTRFMPRRPVAPESDDDASPADPAVGFGRGGDVDYSQRWHDEVAELTPDDGDDDAKSGPGLVAKIKDGYTSLPVYLRIGLPLGLVVALVLGLTMLGGEEPPAPNPTGSGQVIDPGSALPGPDVDAAGEDLLTDYISTVSARCDDGSTGASTAFTADESVAWVCKRVLGIDGAVLNIVFREPVTLTEIRLTPGYDFVRQPSGDDEWNRHRVVTRILWRAGGKQFPQEIAPTRGQAVLTFPEPVVTESMSLTIQESVAPGEVAGTIPGTNDPFSEPLGEGSPSAPVGEVLDATAIQNIEIIGTVR